MKKKSYISTKFIILIPVFILGFVSVVSNILAVTNIKRVNANATQIANGYMSCISELGDIQKETLLIHRLGLSHIVATDLNTMISLVETIRSEQETLETYLDDFQEYVTDDNKAEYDALVSNYEGMKYELANLMAYSANNDNEAAYALANGKIARLFQCNAGEHCGNPHQCQRKCGCGKGTACSGLPDGNRGEHGIHHHQCGGVACNSDLRIPAGNYPSVKDTEGDHRYY